MDYLIYVLRMLMGKKNACAYYVVHVSFLIRIEGSARARDIVVAAGHYGENW